MQIKKHKNNVSKKTEIAPAPGPGRKMTGPKNNTESGTAPNAPI